MPFLQSKPQNRAPAKTRIVLQIWGSSNTATTPDNLMTDPGPKGLVFKKAAGDFKGKFFKKAAHGNTGHIALVVQQELPVNAETPPTPATLDTKTLVQKNQDKILVKVRQQRFSFNPHQNASLVEIGKTLKGSITAFCANYLGDCESSMDQQDPAFLNKLNDAIKRQEKKQEGMELIQAAEYLDSGAVVMKDLQKMVAWEVMEKGNPLAILPMLKILIETVIPDEGSHSLLFFKEVRQTLLENMTKELFSNLQSIEDTESFSFHTGFTDAQDFNKWWEQNKDHPMVRSFCENHIIKPILGCMGQLIISEAAYQSCITTARNHLAELELSARTPMEIDLSYLTRYMDADKLQALMVEALKTGYSLADNTCIQATLNIILKGLQESGKPDAIDILEVLGKQSDIKKDPDGHYKINEKIIDTPKKAYLFTKRLESCYREVHKAELESTEGVASRVEGKL